MAVSRANRLPVPHVKPPLPFQDERLMIAHKDGWEFVHYDCGDNLTGSKIEILNKSKFNRVADVVVYIEHERKKLLSLTQAEIHHFGFSKHSKLVDVYTYALNYFEKYCAEQHREVMFNLGRLEGVNPPTLGVRMVRCDAQSYLWRVCSCRHNRCDICSDITRIKSSHGEAWFHQ